MDTPRPMTRSPVGLARKAVEIAESALPAYSSRYSRKDFTQHQLFALLVLMVHFKTDPRGIVAMISERPKEEACVYATGLEAGRRSAHYAWRTGQKRYRVRCWPKLTLACHNRTHFLLHVVAYEGPSQDAPLFGPVHEGAVRRVRLDRVLADAGYGSERNHRIAREELGIRSSVIKLNRRGGRDHAARSRTLPVGARRSMRKKCGFYPPKPCIRQHQNP